MPYRTVSYRVFSVRTRLIPTRAPILTVSFPLRSKKNSYAYSPSLYRRPPLMSLKFRTVGLLLCL
ncbi:hypothetical protein Hanom_Chr12g01152481 [Helianthus anomalus]